MLTVKQAAKHACVCESIVRSWVRTGQLPHFRLGAKGRRGKIAIAVEDLDALLAEFRIAKREPEPRKATVPVKSAFRHLRIT